TQQFPVVGDAFGRQPVRHLPGAAFGPEQETVLGDLGVQRRAALAPVGYQLAEGTRVHDRARQDVCADLGALVDDAHADLGAPVGGELLQTDGGREAGGPAADDHDVELHRV